MRPATKTKAQSKRGQTLASFCLSLPLFVASVAALLWVVLGQVMTAWLDADTYALARAHLYGNALNRCEGGDLAHLRIPELEVRYECATDGSVSSLILWRGRVLARSKWDLLAGRFERM